jgi:MFS family permease
MTSDIPQAEQRMRIPRTVWVVGFVSLLMDVSSEIIHALLPVFLTATLGAPVTVVGAIDGIAEATASGARIVSGYLSDRIGKRKPLILLGYGLAALTKPMFALATAPALVLGARFADRIGKGLRESPRDALVADITPAEVRGSAFGLRQALDTVGAAGGPLIAIGLMFALANDIRSVFWFAAIPAALAVLLAAIGIRESAQAAEDPAAQPRSRVRLGDLRRLGTPFWRTTAVGMISTLARFSDAFLILKAHAEGLPLALAPLVLVAMNLVYALGAYPAGRLADRVPARLILVLGMTCLLAADLVLALLPGLGGAFVGIALWGGHLAWTQGLFAKLIADDAPPTLRGSAYGLFNLASGGALLFASLIAGILWDHAGSGITFLTSAGFALAALVLIVILPLGTAQASRTS